MIRCATRSVTGRLHRYNQDRVGTDVDRGTFVVVDGMGGLADAAATAQLVVDRLPQGIGDGVGALGVPGISGLVAAVVSELNEHVRGSARSGPDTTGAAVALLLIREDHALTVHVGDSRIYLARGGRLDRLTDDHARDGGLTRFVGMPGEIVAGVAVHDLAVGDRLLLCTDGLTAGVIDEALRTALGSASELDEVCQQLVEAAAAHGVVDDISVIVVQYDGTGGR